MQSLKGGIGLLLRRLIARANLSFMFLLMKANRLGRLLSFRRNHLRQNYHLKQNRHPVFFVRSRTLYTRYFLFLLLSVLTGTTLAADFEIEFEIPEKVEIVLSSGSVDLGAPVTVRPGYVYFEKPSALSIDFRCNHSAEWEVRLYGEDFRAGTNMIPISRLEWKAQGGVYQSMPSEGNYTVLAGWRDYPNKTAAWHRKDISYRLELIGDEYEGTYSSVITYTLFLP